MVDLRVRVVLVSQVLPSLADIVDYVSKREE